MKRSASGPTHAIKGGKRTKTGISFHPGDASDTIDNAFNVPAQDAQGKSEKIIIRVPPSLVRMIDVIKNKPGMGFKTHSDVSRAAIYEGLRNLAQTTVDPALSNLAAVAAGWVNLCRAQEQMRNFAEVVSHVTSEVNAALSVGAADKAKELVRQINRDLKGIDDEFWKKRYQDQINERFGYLLRGGKKDKGDKDKKAK